MDSTAASAAAAARSASTASLHASPAKVEPPAPVRVKAPSTDAFLKDFTLVAEAAKRAQVAVMMRDFANVAL